MMYRLKDRTKAGRPPELSQEMVYHIKEELKESSYGWTTKQVEELIIKKSGIKYHYIHIYHILRKWGFKQKVPRKVHVNTASQDEKDNFKKRSPRYLRISNGNSKKMDLPWYHWINLSSFMILLLKGFGLTRIKDLLLE